jgi:hypothetical protein
MSIGLIRAFRSLSCLLLIAAATGIPTSSLAASQDSPPQTEGVWFWFGDCPDGKLMGVQILIDRRTIYRGRFWMCLMERTDVNSQRQVDFKQTFYFRGGHAFQGRHRTTSSEQIEGDIWEARADPNDIVLGVSFKDGDQVLLNAVHIAKPGKATSSTLDPGLSIRTYPLK